MLPSLAEKAEMVVMVVVVMVVEGVVEVLTVKAAAMVVAWEGLRRHRLSAENRRQNRRH